MTKPFKDEYRGFMSVDSLSKTMLGSKKSKTMFPFSTPGNLPTGITSTSLISSESFFYSFIGTAIVRTSGRTSAGAVRFRSVSHVHVRARAAWTLPRLCLRFVHPQGVPCRSDNAYAVCPRGARSRPSQFSRASHVQYLIYF
jgi:hypothetical protein